MLGVLLVISLLGVVEIYSSTANTPFAGAHTKQIGWITAKTLKSKLMQHFGVIYRNRLPQPTILVGPLLPRVASSPISVTPAGTTSGNASPLVGLS